MAEHKVEIVKVDEDMRSRGTTGFQLQHLLFWPEVNESHLLCNCGAKVPVPFGSLGQYVAELQKQNNPETMVTIRVYHYYTSNNPEKEAADMQKLSETAKNQSFHDTTGKWKNLPYVKKS